MRRIGQGGDTVIEVLVAVVTFSLLAVGSISIMNLGLNSAERALEVTLVRQQITAQAETLRYLHDGYIAQLGQPGGDGEGLSEQWKNIQTIAKNTSSISAFTSNASTCPAIPSAAFIMDAKQLEVAQPTVSIYSMSNVPASVSPPPYAQLTYSNFGDELANERADKAYGIWVEASTPSNYTHGVRYIDFHIRACWLGPGGGTPVRLGTIVRLYDAQS